MTNAPAPAERLTWADFRESARGVVSPRRWAGTARHPVRTLREMIGDGPLLALLVENRERLVSRDELIEKVWDGRIVTDAAIASRVKSARQALGGGRGEEAEDRQRQLQAEPLHPAVLGSRGAIVAFV